MVMTLMACVYFIHISQLMIFFDAFYFNIDKYSHITFLKCFYACFYFRLCTVYMCFHLQVVIDKIVSSK